MDDKEYKVGQTVKVTFSCFMPEIVGKEFKIESVFEDGGVTLEGVEGYWSDPKQGLDIVK